MQSGLFGFSLLFELFVLYFALHVLVPNTDRRWIALFLGLLVLFSFSDLTSANWVEIFSGRFDFFWREILQNFGFR